MARTTRRPDPTAHRTLLLQTTACPECGESLVLDHYNKGTITTLQDVLAQRLGIRRCHQVQCSRFHNPLHPELEGRLALPQHEFELDVVWLTGTLRWNQNRTLAEIHQHLTERNIIVAQRTVGNLLDRYDELRALAALDTNRLHPMLLEEGRAIFAIDGLQPDVGHEVL